MPFLKHKLLFCLFIIFVSTNLHAALNPHTYETKYYFNRSMYSPAYKDLPKILSDSDVEKYYAIQQAQLAHNYKKADQLITTLDNNILVGYVYYARYISPDYHPTYYELKEWLSKYNTLAVASIIYKMAKKKAKYTYQVQELTTTNSFYDRFVPVYMRNDLFKNITPEITNLPNEKPEVIKNYITKRLNRHIKDGNTLNIKRILLSNNTRRALPHQTYDYYAYKLSKLYFLDGNDTLSIYWADKALKHTPKLFSDAAFVRGLSNFRVGNYVAAANSFYSITNSEIYSTDVVAKASYWYARSSLAAGNITNYYKGLKRASKYIYDFYGIIANEELGIDVQYPWFYFNFPKESINLITNNKYGQRALALLQFGLVDWAEQELIFLANYDTEGMSKSDESKMLNALIYMAQEIPMPALGLKFSGELGMYYGLSHLSYPIFFVDLDDEYELDPALLLAIMRQESLFYTGAISEPGATGLMQLMPTTATFIASKYGLNQHTSNRLTEAKYNITIGQKYVETLLNNPNVENNLIYALAGFNGGFLNVSKWKSDSFRHVEDPLFFIESMPFYETRHYVKVVMGNYWIYQKKIGIPRYSLYLLVQGGQPQYSKINHEEIKKLLNFRYQQAYVPNNQEFSVYQISGAIDEAPKPEIKPINDFGLNKIKMNKSLVEIKPAVKLDTK